MIEKKPQAGEFWELNERVKIVGPLSDGATVGETSSGSIRTFKHENGWTHLPDCDSFDWQPETFPQWYAKCCGSPYAECDHIIRTSKTTLCGVLADGTKTKEFPWGNYHEGFVSEGAWVPLTQAEAESRLKKPEQVESPDDWVTQDRVPARVGIDSEHWSNWAADEWHVIWPSQISANRKMMHGHVDEQEDTLSLRCRRRDLPPMPQETPTREYVRCFTTLEGTVRTAKDISEFDMPKLWHELKHDGTGFYLEDGK